MGFREEASIRSGRHPEPTTKCTPDPRVLGVDTHESRWGSEKKNALRNAAQSRTSIVGFTPGSFARTRLIFMPRRRYYWALRILHLADMPAVSLGIVETAPSGFFDCANELCRSGSTNRHGLPNP